MSSGRPKRMRSPEAPDIETQGPAPKQPRRTYATKDRHIRSETRSEADTEHPDTDSDEEGAFRPKIKLLKTKNYTNVSKVADRNHLNDDNWHEWRERIRRVFNNCEIVGYVNGTLKRPDEKKFPVEATNWDKNDSWAQQVIIQNVTSSQMNHVGSKNTAEGMYSALLDTHENTAYQTVTQIQTLLYETKATESTDLLKHLDILKGY